MKKYQPSVSRLRLAARAAVARLRAAKARLLQLEEEVSWAALQVDEFDGDGSPSYSLIAQYFEEGSWTEWPWMVGHFLARFPRFTGPPVWAQWEQDRAWAWARYGCRKAQARLDRAREGMEALLERARKDRARYRAAKRRWLARGLQRVEEKLEAAARRDRGH